MATERYCDYCGRRENLEGNQAWKAGYYPDANSLKYLATKTFVKVVKVRDEITVDLCDNCCYDLVDLYDDWWAKRRKNEPRNR